MHIMYTNLPSFFSFATFLQPSMTAFPATLVSILPPHCRTGFSIRSFSFVASTISSCLFVAYSYFVAQVPTSYSAQIVTQTQSRHSWSWARGSPLVCLLPNKCSSPSVFSFYFNHNSIQIRSNEVLYKIFRHRANYNNWQILSARTTAISLLWVTSAIPTNSWNL